MLVDANNKESRNMERRFWEKKSYTGIILALMLALVAGVGTGCDEYGLVRTTGCGKVKGHFAKDGAVLAWRGIPFARPPVGKFRWKAPEPPRPRKKMLVADESGSPALQFEMGRTWHGTGEIIGSEDCLYLDIYRPATAETDLPVYFWIHGGSNRFGSASAYAANARSMAEKMEVVVVVSQYRLGPFGWFRHESLRDGDPENVSNSGNFGTLDQIRALKWVQQNIAAFGGNPDNVTIAGQSAGGHNVKNLLISPYAEGLFHKAVSQSGIMPVIEANDDVAGTIAGNLGISGEDMADQLRNTDAQAILAASEASYTYSAYADGYVIPDTVVNAVHQGNYNHVPVMLGVNQEEFYNFLPLYGGQLGKPNWNNVHDLFNPDFDPDKAWTYEEIFPPNADEELIYQTAGTYVSKGYRAKYLDELAACLREQQDSVYGYVFQWAGGGVQEMETFSKVFGAAHSMEISFFFGGEYSLFGYSFIEANEAGRKDLQKAMQTYLYNFMTTGDPGVADDGTPWESWSNEAGMFKAISFDADASQAQLRYIDDRLTFEDVEVYLRGQLAKMSQANAQRWGFVLRNFRQQPDPCGLPAS